MHRIVVVLGLAATAGLSGCAPTEAKVRFIDPVAGATVQPDGKIIRVTFDRSMDASTITTATFLVSGSESGPHTGAIIYDDASYVVTFTIVGTLVPGETLTVTLTADIRSLSKKSLRRFSATFTVYEEPPVVLPPFDLESLTPTFETVSAPRLSAVTLGYSAVVNPFTVTAQSVRIEGERSGARSVAFENLFGGTGNVRAVVDRMFLAGERITVAARLLASIDGVAASPALLGFTVRNLASSWPEAPLAEGALAAGGWLQVADFDLDGRDEWLVCEADGTFTLQGATDGVPGLVQGFAFPGAVRAVAVGDVNGDRRLDVIALAAAGDRLYLCEGTDAAGQGFLLPRTVSLGGFVARTLTCLHADADGIRDVFLAPVDVAHGAHVRFGAATNSLSRTLSLTNLPATGLAVAADFDGDDLPDLAVPVAGGAVQVLHGVDGSGTLSNGARIELTHPTVALLLASLDGDDLVDLVCLTDGSAPGAVLLSDGQGAFTAVSLEASAGSGSAVADWNGDGVLDLLVPVAGASGVDLFLGLGDGTFGDATRFETSDPVVALALGDLDGDGSLDPALALSTRWEVGAGTPVDPPAGNTDRIFVEDLTATVGAIDVPFVVRCDSTVAVEGYTIVVAFDPALISIGTLTAAGTDAGALGVEFEIPQVNTAAGYFVFAAIFDFLPPYDGQALPPGQNQSLLVGQLTVSPTAPATETLLEPTSNRGSPPADSSFVVAGMSLEPTLEAGVLTISAEDDGPSTPPSTPTASFVRGDANGDSNVNVSDVSFIGLYLFEGGAAPPCFDAADVNDDGQVNISDTSYLYAYLFGSGPQPPSPFPTAGPDTTSDGLGCGD